MADAAKVSGKDPTADLIPLSHALKEWAIAINALYTGNLIVLLRKGGIKDSAKPFADLHPQSLLFPTYEHQVAQAIRTPHLTELGNPDSDISLRCWVQITHRFALSTLPEIDALMPFHIWTKDFIAERLKWRPQQPLQVLCLRTYRLHEPFRLVRSPHYAGCRSWITLETPIFVDTHSPALSDEQYSEQLKALEASLQLHSDFALESCRL
jgi:hypothetical protein